MSYINRKLMLFFILLIFSSITLVSATNNLDSDNGCIDDINLKSMDDNLKNTGNVLEDNIKMESKTIEDTNSNNYYYFNASVSSDNGNGTQSNPWKTINNNRINSIANNSHVYITNGQYNITNDINIKNNMNIIGESTEDTIIYTMNDSKFYINENITANISNIYFTEEYNDNRSTSTILNDGYLVLNNTLFKNNHAVYGGVLTNHAILVINNSQFFNNSADYKGGVIYSTFLEQNNELYIYNSNFSENHVNNGIYIRQKLNFCGGNIIHADKTKSMISNSTFINNNVANNTTEAYGGVLFFNESILNIIDSKFINNSASIGGSILFRNGYINIDSSTFINSTALNGWGGSIGIQNSSSNIRSTNFIDSKAPYNVGGALMILQRNEADKYDLDDINVNISDCYFSNNIAYYGGAIGVFGVINLTGLEVDYLDGVLPAVVNITNSEFFYNIATFDGGAIYGMYSNISSLNNSFIYNKISKNNSCGSIIFAYRGNLTINENELIDNNNNNNNNSYTIYNYENDLNITNSVIKTNHAIYNNPYIKTGVILSKLTIENNWWTNNNPNWKHLLNNINNTPNSWATLKFTNTTPLNKNTVDLELSLNTQNNNDIINLPTRIALFIATNGTLTKKIVNLQGKINNTFTGGITDIITTVDGYSIKLSNKELPSLTSNNIISAHGKNITITANINNDSEGYVIIKINSNTISSKIQIYNGTINYNYTIPSNWTSKDYTITIKYSGDKKYQNNTINTILTLEKTDTIINILPITTTPKTMVTLKANITNDQGYIITSGNVVFKINNKTISDKIQITNGKISFNYTTPEKTKTYNITVVYSGNSKTKSAQNNTTLTIKENNKITTETINPINNINTQESITIPETYDLRKLGLVTPVKAQGAKGSCWAFAAISSIESTLLKKENKTYNLSENHLQNLIGLYSTIGLNFYDNGGNILAMVYLASWLGCVNSSDDPYYSFNIISPRLEEVIHVQDVIFLDGRANTTDNNKLKEEVMQYGAISVGCFYNETCYNETSCSYYDPSGTYSNHAVSLVGWDDNYDKNNFNTPAPDNGAFIVKNSWGSNWGDNGYFYVSYYDPVFAKNQNMAISNVESISNYDHIYQYELLPTMSKTYGKETIWYANQFISQQDETLDAVGTYFQDSSIYNYQINVYVNNELKLIQNETTTISGYKTITLNQKIQLNKNDVFKVVIKLETPNSNASICLQSNTPQISAYNKATFKSNSSFISPDGIHWEDIAYSTEYINGNVCIKAFTTNSNLLAKDMN